MGQARSRVVFLTSASPASSYFAAVLARSGRLAGIVYEKRTFRWRAEVLLRLLRRRGVLKVLDQIAYRAVERVLAPRGHVRLEGEAYSTGPEDCQRISSVPQCRVSDINAQEILDFIEPLAPDLLIVKSTSIIRGKLLERYSCRIFNFHAGITPEYRGVHAPFWALFNGERGMVGATIHLVDRGIDTGGILEQESVPVDPSVDSFFTIYVKLNRKGAELMLRAIEKFESGSLLPFAKKGATSRLYSFPGLTDYCRYVCRTRIR